MCLGAHSLLDGTRAEAFIPFLYNYEWIWWYLYWWGGCDVWCEWFCQWINSWIAQFGHPALHRALWSGSSPVSNQFHSSQCSSQQWKMSAAFNLDSSLHHRPMVCFHCGYWAIHHQGGGCKGSYLGLIGLIIPYYLCYPGLLAFITFCIIVTNKDIFLDIYWMLPIHVIYHVSGGKGGDGIRTRYCSLGAGLLCFWPLSANCQCSGAFFTSLCLFSLFWAF